MGREKASLLFGDELMLQRVVRLVSQVVEPKCIVCVAAAGQDLPKIPCEVRVAHDRQPDRGPLEGLAVGIATLDDVAAAYATSCDVPLLVPAFVQRMFEQLGNHDIVVPRDGKFHHPLAAVYRPRVLPEIEALLAVERLRPVFLFDECDTRQVSVDALRDVDPELHSLLNCNRPDDYQRALALVGFAD